MSPGLPGSVVVDASVAAKWYLPEGLSEEATLVLEAGVRGDLRLYAPGLLPAELGNVLWLRHRRGEVSIARVREIWAAFEAAPLSLAEPVPLAPAALEIAVRCGRTVYDALYVALVEARRGEDAVVLTADRKLVARLDGTPFAARVRRLTPAAEGVS